MRAMPNKTIYVADDDLPVYARAQELAGGSLSSVIAAALRHYVDYQEGLDEGYKEITIKVGRGKNRRAQRFIGALLGEWGTWDNNKATHWKVYRSRKGKYVVQTERTTEAVQTGDSSWRTMIGLTASGGWGVKPAETTLTVIDTLDELQAVVPAELYDMVAGAPAPGDVEDLDV
jgi:EXLDI family protein